MIKYDIINTIHPPNPTDVGLLAIFDFVKNDKKIRLE
jgi:hypothetical protein